MNRNVRAKQLLGWFDSCPTDALSPKPGAFHSCVFMIGQEALIDRTVTELHRLEPELPKLVAIIDPLNGGGGLAKWCPPDANQKRVKQYRAMLRRSLIKAMTAVNAPALVWSVIDAHIDDFWSKLCHSLGLQRSQVTIVPHGRGREKMAYMKRPTWPRLAPTQYKFLLCVADFICSTLRAERKQQLDEVIFKIITDFIAGDCHTDTMRGSLLLKILQHADNYRTTIHYRSTTELPRGLLLADNLAGLTYQMLENPDAPELDHVWQEYESCLRSGPVIWNHNSGNFNAVTMDRALARSLRAPPQTSVAAPA